MTTFVEAIEQAVKDTEQDMTEKAYEAYCISVCGGVYADCSCSEFVKFKKAMV